MKSMIEELKKYDIVLILGNYGAGKSSLAREYFGDRKRVNRHEIRYHFKEMTEHGKKWTTEDWDEEIEGFIKRLEYDIIKFLLERNERIVIDNTSVTKKSRERYINYARRFKKSIACLFLKKDVSVLLSQNKMREHAVPEHIIVRLHAKTELPTESEGFNKVVVVR